MSWDLRTKVEMGDDKKSLFVSGLPTNTRDNEHMVYKDRVVVASCFGV